MSGFSNLPRWPLSALALAVLAAAASFQSQHRADADDRPNDVADADFSAELPRIPPRDPVAGQQSIETKPGYRVDLIAAEPEVVDPVAMCFDADGRLYVVEMRDYSEQDKEQLGRIRILEDEDGDGRYERATVFADGLSWPTAIINYDGGVFVGAPPLLLYLKDADGDRRADIRRVVFSGFSRSNVQGMMNSLRWGLDNRIHGAASSTGGQIVRPDVPEMKPIDLSGRDFSFDPRQLDLRPESGGAQHGMCFDDWGRKYCCSNSDHLQVVMYEDRYAARHPFLKAPSARVSIAADGGQATVYRRSPVEPWRIVRTRLRAAGQVPGPLEGGGTPAGYFTSATGVTIYRGDALPKDRGRAFIADVGSNIVHRKEIDESDLVPSGRRIDEQSEFLASDDIWFRPVQFANAPDGALHILDMSREVIEHPRSLPPMIKRHLDLTSGRDRGRIYRVTTSSYRHRPSPQLSSRDGTQLVQLLGHPNAWHRESAVQQLRERRDLSVVADLESMATDGDSALGRLHALQVLDGLGAITDRLLARVLGDSHPRIRQHAVRLSEAHPDSAVLRQHLQTLIDDPDVQVRLQLAFTIGEFPTSWRAPIAARLLANDGSDDWIQFAVFSSLSTGAGAALEALLAEQVEDGDSAGRQTLGDLAQLIGRQADESQVARALQATVEATTPAELRDEILKRLVLGLADSNSSVKGQLAAAADDSTAAMINRLLDKLITQARQTAFNERASVVDRVSALRTLSLGLDSDDASKLLDLFDHQVANEVQLAALDTLADSGSDDVADSLVERWSTLGPQIRSEAMEVLLSRPAWTAALLTAIEANSMPQADWNPARLALLKTTAAPEMQKRIGTILANAWNQGRKEVIAEYQEALRLEGDIDRGRQAFRKTCAACHQLENKGSPIGPNLAAMISRGAEAVLVNVLDPNREVNPAYVTYLVQTIDGRSHSGMIGSQSATTVTLLRADGHAETILREDIEVMRSSGVSLMPEGLEREISVAQMADLLAYLAAPR